MYEPELAQALYDAREKKWDETVAMAKEQNHNTELKMTRVLRGNKSYKELDTSSYYSFVEYTKAESSCIHSNAFFCNVQLSH